MAILCILLSAVTLLSVLHSVTSIRKVKRQISEMQDALSDIKGGNGNRRILAKPHELTAPIAYEINEIVLSYENKLSAFRRAEEANRQLMTSLSHDVRTPLTTLIGYLDAAYKGIVTGKERDDYIEIARCKSHDLKEYIDVLFDWFKLNSDEFSLKMEPVEAVELTRNMFLRKLCSEKGKTILISSHILSEISLLADDIGILHRGVLLEEESLASLEQKSCRYVHFTVSDAAQAARILEQFFREKDFSVLDDRNIRLYNPALSVTKAVSVFIENGLEICEARICEDSLEEHFKKITGGEGIA